jgi:hypothetical protein
MEVYKRDEYKHTDEWLFFTNFIQQNHVMPREDKELLDRNYDKYGFTVVSEFFQKCRINDKIYWVSYVIEQSIWQRGLVKLHVNELTLYSDAEEYYRQKWYTFMVKPYLERCTEKIGF